MANKKQPPITFSIPEIMETIEQKYDKEYSLAFDCYGEAFIVYQDGMAEVEFNNLRELHVWVAKTRIALDGEEADQLKENHDINAKSANVDIMKQRF